MLVLDNTDVLEGGASVDAVVDYTFHGLVGDVLTQLAAGSLSDTLTAALYTAGDIVVVMAITLVNTHSAAVDITLRLDPADGGNPRYIIPETMSLGIGYSLHTDGVKIAVLDTNGFLITATTAAAHAMSTHTDEDTYNINTSGSATVAALTIGGTLTVAENPILLDSAISADGKYSGITATGVIGYASAAFGELVYLANADGRWEKTDADAEATAGDVELAMVISSGASDGDACVLLKYGYIREDDWNWTSPGDALYVDATTAGGMTTTRPSGSADIVRVVGYQQPDTNTILFDPSNSWVEIA